MISTNDALVVDGDDPSLPDVPDQFRIHDRGSANWLVRKIVEARKYADDVRAWAAAEIGRAEREEDYFIARFEPQLKVWTAQQITKMHGKKKSLNLPAGTVGFRTFASKLLVDDEATVIRWSQKNCPAAVSVMSVTKLHKTILDEHVAKTGELPEGVYIEGGGEKFYVR